VKDNVTNSTWAYSPLKVSEIVVNAEIGAANFTATATNPATARLVVFNGGSGTDTFTGTSGTVSMKGGSGSDTLTSIAGNDTLVGGSGTDYIKGGTGSDLLEAGTGTNYLIAGTGISTVVGGIGNDTIVAMNGQADDTVDTGIGTEVIWVDDINGLTDIINGSTTNDTVQAVPGFANSGPSGPTNVLAGGTFAEPALLAGNVYEAFANRPLFSTAGPTAQDVNQYINPKGGGVNGTGTTLDDSWLLAGLAAIAKEDPTVIEQNVVSFGDGTYGVKLGSDYYRVDDKLPVNLYGETFTAYASLGAQNSIWVPIVEKAFAYFASQGELPNYANLEAVNGGVAVDVYEAFGASPANSGSIPLSGTGGFASASLLGSAFQLLLNEGYSTSVGLTAPVMGDSVTTGAVVTLAANREYTVLSYHVSLGGVVTSVVLRDPSGANPSGVTVYLTNAPTGLTDLFNATKPNGTLDFGLV
jgi:hypothetical protein